MRALPWPSDTFQRLKPRERRVVLGGAVVSAAALVTVLIVLPVARRWAVREAAYAASREQWVRLAGLAANTDRLRRALDEQRLVHAPDAARLVTGPTPALAASTLQGLLQRYADESSVQLDRVDVVGDARPDKPGLLAIPVRLQGRGDIYGLVDFLYRVQWGEKLLVIDEMSANAGIGWPGGLALYGRQEYGLQPYLSWSIRLHGLYATREAGS
jgi:type II secretory pathway component PulM